MGDRKTAWCLLLVIIPSTCEMWILAEIPIPPLPSSLRPSGLAEDFLQDYIQVNIGSLDLCANHNITQIVEICEDYEKDYK